MFDLSQDPLDLEVALAKVFQSLELEALLDQPVLKAHKVPEESWVLEVRRDLEESLARLGRLVQ